MGGDEKGRGHHGSSRKHERDKHGEEEKITSAKKRRWSDSEAVDGTPNVLKPKQVSAEVVADLVSKDAELRQLCQSQIRQLYLHLATLTDFSNSASGPSSNEGEQLKAFQALLEASQGEHGGMQSAMHECRGMLAAMLATLFGGVYTSHPAYLSLPLLHYAAIHRFGMHVLPNLHCPPAPHVPH